MALAPGTPNPGSSDPRTIEQNATIQRLIAGTDTSALPNAYKGSLLYPDGQITRDYSVLVKPPARVAEIDAVLAAGITNALSSGGYVLALNTDGVPVQYIPCAALSVATTPAPVVPATAPTPTTTTTPTGTTNTVTLTKIVELSATEVIRQYVKGTLKAIASQTITAKNVSPDVEVQLSFGPQTGLTFDPTTFLLTPNSSKSTLLTFDLAKIDTLPEGLTVFNVPISLTSPTAIAPAPVATPPAITSSPAAPQPPVIIYPTPAPAPPPPAPAPAPAPVPTAPPAPPPPAGKWVLVETAPAYSTSETVVTFRAPENGQEPGARNGFRLGMYDTTYGYTRTTTYGPVYDYTLEGNLQTAGTKPMAPARSVTVTEDSDKYQQLSNIYLRSMEEQAAIINGQQPVPPPPAPTPPPAPPPLVYAPPYVPPTPPPVPMPAPPPDEVSIPFRPRLPVIIDDGSINTINDGFSNSVGAGGVFTGGGGGGGVSTFTEQSFDGSVKMTDIAAE